MRERLLEECAARCEALSSSAAADREALQREIAALKALSTEAEARATLALEAARREAAEQLAARPEPRDLAQVGAMPQSGVAALCCSVDGACKRGDVQVYTTRHQMYQEQRRTMQR